jgi:hypothetical protein
MQFFDFGNSVTFHYFKWVSESGQADPDALIGEAFRKAETDTEHFPGEDVCMVVRDNLAGLLTELLADVVPDVADDSAFPLGGVWNSPESLWKPILAHAIWTVDCQAVAEALLIRAGKWNPSKEPPECV